MSFSQRSFAKDEYIFQEGDAPKAIYIIKKGTVSIRKRKGASFVEMGRLYTNEVLGEMSFFDRKPRSASAVAETEVDVMEIQMDALDKVYAPLPDYLKSIINSVVERLRKANGTIRTLQNAAAGGLKDDPDAILDSTEEELNALLAEDEKASKKD